MQEAMERGLEPVEDAVYVGLKLSMDIVRVGLPGAQLSGGMLSRVRMGALAEPTEDAPALCDLRAGRYDPPREDRRTVGRLAGVDERSFG